MIARHHQREFRTAVKKAHEQHCRAFGRTDYDSWYRSELKTAFGVESSRDLNDHDLPTILAHFEGSACKQALDIQIKGWSPNQNKHFNLLAKSAWQKAAGAMAFETFVEVTLLDHGFIGRAAPDKTKSFDSVMSFLAIMANDEFWIDRTSKASEIRMMHAIEEQMTELSQLLGSPITWAYIRGIWSHMALPIRMEDAPALLLWKVLQALDTHIRRTIKAGAKNRLDKESMHEDCNAPEADEIDW